MKKTHELHERRIPEKKKQPPEQSGSRGSGHSARGSPPGAGCFAQNHRGWELPKGHPMGAYHAIRVSGVQTHTTNDIPRSNIVSANKGKVRGSGAPP